AVSWARGHPSHPDTPPNIYEGGLGARQQQCPSAQGSRPKNFRLRHLRALALYLPGHMRPAGQCESHWLGRLMAGACFPGPEATAWPLDLPQGTLGPGPGVTGAAGPPGAPPTDSSSLLSSASSSSVDPAKGAPPLPNAAEGLGLRPKRSWRASGEPPCPLCKRTRSGALERP
ncbi:putative protein C16orf90, partial [Galemys pyrenaicus]